MSVESRLIGEAISTFLAEELWRVDRPTEMQRESFVVGEILHACDAANNDGVCRYYMRRQEFLGEEKLVTLWAGEPGSVG